MVDKSTKNKKKQGNHMSVLCLCNNMRALIRELEDKKRCVEEGDG